MPDHANRKLAQLRKRPSVIPDPLLLDAAAAGALCGFGRATWWKLERSGRCPLPIRLGRKVLWRRTDLEAWIAQACPARDAAAAAQYRQAKRIELAAIAGEGGGR